MEKVQLIVGSHRFHASADLLSDKSDYFKALFNSGMQETVTNKVFLPDFDNKAMEIFINFVEDGTILNFDIDLAEELMEVTSYFQMLTMAEKVTMYLKDNLTVQNCRKMRNLGNNFHYGDLMKFADEYLYKHITEFFKTDEFKRMASDEVAQLLAKDDLYLNNEKDVFDAVINWISSNSSNRVQKRDLLSTIRFPLLEGSHFVECVDTLTAMGLNEICNDFIEETKLYHRDPYIVHKLRKLSFRPRRLIPCVVAVGGFTGKEHSTNRFQIVPLSDLQLIIGAEGGEIQFESIRQQQQEHLKFGKNKLVKLPSALCEHCTCVCDNFLYVAGGQTQYCQDGRYTRNTVYRFNPANCTWLEVCPMATPRSLFYLGVMDGKLYAVGGWKAPDTVTRRVECYHPAENRWTSVASLSMGLHEHAGCIANSIMYVSGGYKGPYRGHLDNLWSYNSGEDAWVDLKRMSHGRSYHSMAPSGHDKIIVVGGVNYLTESDTFEDVRDCEVYCISTDSWSTITQTHKCTSCASSILLDGLLIVFGGHSFEEEGDHKSGQILNLNSCTWQEKPMKSNNILYFASDILNIPETVIKSGDASH